MYGTSGHICFWNFVAVEFELPFVVTFKESWTMGVVLFKMNVVNSRVVTGVPAVLTHVNLGSSLLVSVLELDVVDFPAVRFQGAPLGESFVAKFTFVGTNSCKNKNQIFQNLLKYCRNLQEWEVQTVGYIILKDLKACLSKCWLYNLKRITTD